jgi:hypothetical protein
MKPPVRARWFDPTNGVCVWQEIPCRINALVAGPRTRWRLGPGCWRHLPQPLPRPSRKRHIRAAQHLGTISQPRHRLEKEEWLNPLGCWVSRTRSRGKR